jgi:flagellar assembly protein FliH
MLSKILHPAEAEAAESYVFQTVSGAASPSRRGASNPPQGRRADDTRDGRESHDSGPLRERIASLELQLTQQAATIRKDSLREGEAQGRARAEAEMKPIVEKMGRTIQQVLDTKPALRKQVEEEAVQLALAVSRRILRRELSIDPSALHGLVQAAFERVARQETTRVVVHPDQAVQVRAALASATTRNIEVVPDGSRESGTLIFETTRGSVDASLDSQLREIELGLADRLKWH